MRIRLGTRLLAVSIAAVCLGACTETGERFNSKNFGDGDSVFVDASQRGIYSSLVTPASAKAKDDSEPTNTGRVVPKRVVCAEPSPDVAVAVASAFQAALSASVGTVKADVSGAASFAKEAAEALTQLGKRTSTIQAMREALYRMCQDYANGLVTDVIYAMTLSRFGDSLVTLFGIETVTGSDIGTGGAAVSTAANSSVNQEAVAAAKKLMDGAEGDLKKKQDDTKTLTADLAKIDKAKNPDEHKAKTDELANSKSAETAALTNLRRAQEDFVRTQTVGATLQTAAAEAAKPPAPLAPHQTTAVTDMQRSFVTDGATGAMLVGCTVALDRLGNASDLSIGTLMSMSQTRTLVDDARRDLASARTQTARNVAQRKLDDASGQLAQAYNSLNAPWRLSPYQMICLTEVMPRAARIIDADRLTKENYARPEIIVAGIVAKLKAAQQAWIAQAMTKIKGLVNQTSDPKQREIVQKAVEELSKI